ncbi:MAG TPA: MarR family transcriptional regulator [Candidatus Dormibacteraeota bacterium]|nr:MarR family transcriptional regulator [Candidatus Dormibacteraeota bacterium]
MLGEVDASDVAVALHVGLRLLVRRLRQLPAQGELTAPESSALVRLDRGGPATVTALARLEQISAQSMGATLNLLDSRGLIERRPDPDDGRRAFISITEAGLELLRRRRSAKTEQMARALAADFSAAEMRQLLQVAPLLERLAQSI